MRRTVWCNIPAAPVALSLVLHGFACHDGDWHATVVGLQLDSRHILPSQAWACISLGSGQAAAHVLVVVVAHAP